MSTKKIFCEIESLVLVKAIEIDCGKEALLLCLSSILKVRKIDLFRKYFADLEDEVEEVRELLYEIVTKAGLDGIETSQLAKEYEKQFVDFGIGRPLPSNWLRYVKVADEFDMRQEGDKTFISVIQRDANKLVEKVRVFEKGFMFRWPLLFKSL